MLLTNLMNMNIANDYHLPNLWISKIEMALYFGSKYVLLIILKAENEFLFITDNFKSFHIPNLEVKIFKHIIIGNFSTDNIVF